jgi:hypothetical protein
MILDRPTNDEHGGSIVWRVAAAASSKRPLTQVSMEANLSVRLCQLSGRTQKALQKPENLLDITVVARHFHFECCQLGRQLFPVSNEHSQTDKSVDEMNAHVNRTSAVQNGGRHQRAMLGKSQRRDGRKLQSRKVITICDNLSFVPCRQPKHESYRETLAVTFHGLIKDHRLDAIKLCQIQIENDLLSANQMDPTIEMIWNMRRLGRGHVTEDKLQTVKLKLDLSAERAVIEF